LRQQEIRGHLQLGGKLGYVGTRHSVLFSMWHDRCFESVASH
jgi:hypothetical protein